MKKLIMIFSVLIIAGCSQDKPAEHAEAVHDDMQNHSMNHDVVMEKEDKPNAVVEQQSDVEKEAEIKPVQVAPTQSEVVIKKEVAVKPEATVKVEASKPVTTTVVSTAPEAVKVAPVQDKKVVAPLVQGKAPIKSEPNPAPSDKMIKAEPVVMIAMDAAKAKSLTKKCKSCHAMDKDKVGPSWKKIQAAYGSADTLAAVFKSGFAVGDREVAKAEPKFKKKAKVMTGQYKNLIKKQVEKGKFTYNELASAIFAQ